MISSVKYKLKWKGSLLYFLVGISNDMGLSYLIMNVLIVSLDRDI